MYMIMVLYFLLGSIFGSALMHSIKEILINRSEYSISYKGIDKFIESPLTNYEFISRTNHFTKITMGDYDLYLDLSKKELNIFHKKELLIFTSDLNRSKMLYLFERLRNGFHYDIYVNVTIVNNSIISNNILNNINDNKEIPNDVNIPDITPTLDEILDKINKHGIDNLTQSDLDILNGDSVN